MPRTETKLAPIVLRIMESANLSAMQFSESTRLQATNIARKAGVQAGDDILRTYCFFREFFFKCDKIDGKCPTCMSDQELFGEVLLIRGEAEDFLKLKKAYPNIFG